MAFAPSQHLNSNAAAFLKVGPAALHPDLAAHSLDHTAEEFDFPDPGLTFMPDLGPQHGVLAPQILNVGLEAGDLGIGSCGW
jgi:hypothetical protein